LIKETQDAHETVYAGNSGSVDGSGLVAGIDRESGRLELRIFFGYDREIPGGCGQRM
jgi:hypothetical protein